MPPRTPKRIADTLCPYCERELKAAPKNGTACPRCGQVIYVHKSALNGTQLLMTEDGHYQIVQAKKRRKSSDYFTARAQELKFSFERAVASTTHYGELGRELEAAVKTLLSEYLPNKYSVTTGFVRSLQRPGWLSNQIDILFSRSDICYPIAVHREYNVYPLESIISFMEVTSRLTRGKLREDYEKVAELQRQNRRLYVIPHPPAGAVYYPAYGATHPRFYYFAFDSTATTPESVARNMLDLSNQYRIQLHGLFVLKPGWYFSMPNAVQDEHEPYKGVGIVKDLPQSLIAFLEHILVSLQTADFIPPNASIPFSHYFDPGFTLPVVSVAKRRKRRKTRARGVRSRSRDRKWRYWSTRRRATRRLNR